MKILYLNGADIEGGAAKAAYRLLHAVHAEGADARLYVQRKYGDSPLVDGPRSIAGKAIERVRPTFEQLLCGIGAAKTNGPFCASYLPDRLSALIDRTAPDIVHLHWVARMMRLETLRRFNLPIVWTMHDSWPFTGGCYLPGDCTRYRESCGRCPALGSSRDNDLSRRIWERKRDAWRGLNLTLIAPSRWMAASAQNSSLFCDKRIEVIPNGIDINRFTQTDTRTARSMLSLPLDKKLVLFGAKDAARDRNKGFHLLMEALLVLSSSPGYKQMELVTFGSAELSLPLDCGIKTHCMGWQSDDTNLSQLYSAADVFVLPSIQENLPYAVMEAMACGTPCVAFNQGGVPDLIDHHQNGYLAQPYEICDLAQGISWILENEERRKELSIQAKTNVEWEFSTMKIAERHMKLYGSILGSNKAA